MTDQLFDKFIRDKLGNHPSPVPGGMWERIAAEEKRRTRAAWLQAPRLYMWLAALLLLISGGAWLWQQSASSSNTLSHQPNQSLSNNKSTLPSAAAGNNSGDRNSAATGTIPADSLNSLNGTTNLINDAASSATGGNTGIAGADNNTTYLHEPAGRNTDAGSSNANASQFNSSWGTNGLPAVNSDGSSNRRSADALQQQPFAPGFATTDSIARYEWLQASQAASLKSLLNKQANKKMMPVIQCPNLGGPLRNDLYVELYASPDYVMKSSTANPGYSNYLVRKDSAESMRTSFTVGARFSKSLSEHLLAKAGFQYSQVNERLTTQVENERKLVTVITTHTIVPTPGDTMVVRDTSSYEQIGYRKKTTANRYKSIDIPLLLSYEWGNDQWKFAVNGGAIINLYSWYSGQILDTSFNAVSINAKGAQSTYKRNIGVGAYAGFSVMRTISDNMEIFAEPYFRYNFSNMTQPGQTFNQKFKTAGLSLGIRYRLNNSGQRFGR